MTLEFQTKWGDEMGGLAGMPNHFVEKIWTGLIEKTSLSIEDYSVMGICAVRPSESLIRVRHSLGV